MFSQARFTLTLWYVGILMLVSLSFSTVIYRMLTYELDRFSELQRLHLERRLREGTVLPQDLRQRMMPHLMYIDEEIINETKRRIVYTLSIVNGGILIISGGLAYFLSGKTLQPIKRMVDDQNQFISDASHELKTPLTALKSTMEVQLRAKKITPAQVKTLLTENIQDVNKLQSLTEGLLQLAQFQTLPYQSKTEVLSLRQIIGNAVTKVKPLAVHKSITITDDTQDIPIRGTGDDLSDLFIILLDNAIKYSPQKSKIVLTSRKTDASVQVKVKDQGIGMSKHDIPRIFDRFYRSDSARSKTGTNGFGLGLSIARKIAERHRGEITVTSQPGKGSEFSVRLPVK